MKLIASALAVFTMMSAESAKGQFGSGPGSGNYNGFYYSPIGTSHVQINGYDGAGGAIIIPSTIISGGSNYPVISIGENLHGYKSVTSITIPSSVTSIANTGFGDCPSLTGITIPNSVTSIGAEAFEGCSSLTGITIPNSVTSIEVEAFQGCSSLTSITIPNSITNIEAETFYDCTSLASVTIPNSVTSIEEEVFSGCSSLTSITIPNSVTSIGEYAFDSCSSLTNITIPSSVTSIGEYAFDSCSSLEYVCFGGNEPPDDGTIFVSDAGLSIIYYINGTTGWASEFDGIPTAPCAMCGVLPAPSVTTTAANAIGSSYATLNGTVNPNGSDTIVFFQFGTNTLYGGSTPAQDMGNGSSPVAFSAYITNLTPNVAYDYQAVAIGAGVTNYGADMNFTTLSNLVGSVVGVVLSNIAGNVTVTHPDGTTDTLEPGDPIEYGDLIQTFAGGTVTIQFVDNTQLTLSVNTKATIDNYIYNPNDNSNNSFYGHLQGFFLWVSGLIGKKANPSVNIETAVGDLGIRGTQFITSSDPCSSTQTVYLIEGELGITPTETPGVTNICDAPVTIYITPDSVTTNTLTQDMYNTVSNQLLQAIGTFPAWQEQYFGCTNNPDAAPDADPDGDGVNNYAEFLAGTNPTNSASYFHIISATNESNDMLVSWLCGGGRTNVLQATTNLGGSWSNVSPNIVLAGSGDSVTNYLDVGGFTNTPARFYRVLLVQ